MNLASRGIAEPANALQWTRGDGCWDWAYWDIDGNLLGYRRRYDGRKPYWLSHTSDDPDHADRKMHPQARYYHPPNIRDLAEPVMYGVEGETDLLTAHAMGIHSVIGIFGTSGLGDHLPPFLTELGVREFRFIADNDEAKPGQQLGAGQELGRKVRDALGATAISPAILSLEKLVDSGGDLNDLWVSTGFDAIEARHIVGDLPALLLPKFKERAKRNSKPLEVPSEIRDLIAQHFGLYGSAVDSAGYYRKRIPCPIHGGEDANAKLSATTGNIECKSQCGGTIPWTKVIEHCGIIPAYHSSRRQESAPDNIIPFDEPPPDIPPDDPGGFFVPDYPTERQLEPEAVATNIFGSLSPEAVAGALEVIETKFRLDIRKGATQVRKVDETDWRYIDDFEEAAVRSQIESSCQLLKVRASGSGALEPLRFPDNQWRQYTFAMLDGLRVDPVIEWLEALPEWDGMHRLALLMPICFAVEENAYTEWCGFYLPLGAIQRSYEPACVLDEALILQGQQKLGKSRFGEMFIPQQYRDAWFTRALDLAADPKVKIEATLGKLICEINEMAGSTRADRNEIKKFMTATNDGDVRLAYRHHPETRKRRWVMYGTTNDDSSLPNDPTGLRRFAVLEVFPGGMHCTDYIPQHRDQLWAEALAAYRAGRRANLPDALVPKAADIAERHRYKDESLENIIAESSWTPGKWYTPATIAFMVGLVRESNTPIDRSTSTRLGNALRSLHWKRDRITNGDGSRQYMYQAPPGAGAATDKRTELL